MPRGGARPNSGPRRPIAGTRKWFRDLVEDPKRRAKVEAIIDQDLAENRLENYWKAVEHGFGRPPQALDVKVGGGEGPLEFEIQFSDGSTAAPLPTNVSTPDVSGSSS